MRTLGLIALVLAACGSNSGNSVGTEQQNGLCEPNPTTLTGSAAAGASCKSAGDCQPSCCQCTAGSNGQSYWAAECRSGSCATPAAACADARSASLCP